MSKELVGRYQIRIQPMSVSLGDRIYRDGVDITPDDIYAHHAKTGQLPKTSAINVAKNMEYFEGLTKDGSAVIHFTISSSMSSTYNNACVAAREFENVYVVDGKNLSTGNGLLVLAAAKMAQEGSLRDEMPKWIADGEAKILWHMESMFEPLRRDYHPFQKTALMFGANYNIALDLLQQIQETKKQDNGFFRTYNQILFVPMDEFGVRLLRLVTSVNWREELLSSLFEPEQYTAFWGSLQFDVLVDGIDTYCFLNRDIRNLFNFRNTILMRKEGLLRHGLIVGHKVICYPEQLALVQEFFGDLADISTVSIDDVERVLELDNPSLIE